MENNTEKKKVGALTIGIAALCVGLGAGAGVGIPMMLMNRGNNPVQESTPDSQVSSTTSRDSSLPDGMTQEEMDKINSGGAADNVLMENFVKSSSPKDDVKELEAFLNHFDNKNTCYQVQISKDNYEYCFYNTDGEMIMHQSNGDYTILRTKDGHYIKSSKMAGETQDTTSYQIGLDVSIDFMAQIHNVVTAVEHNVSGYTLYKSYREIDDADAEKQHVTLNEYIIDIYGDDAFFEMYSSCKEDLGEYIYQNIVELGNGQWVPHFKLVLSFSNDFNMMASLYALYNESLDANWVCIGNTDCPYFSLSDYWYKELNYSSDFTPEEVLTHLNSEVSSYFDTIAKEMPELLNNTDESSKEESTKTDESSATQETDSKTETSE